MILTFENIHAVATSGCGFNAAQLHLLGVTDMSRGWVRKLEGKEIPDATYALLLELKGAKPGRQKELVPDRRPMPANGRPGSRFCFAQEIGACRVQFRHLLLCLKAGEKIAAQDHARAIVDLLK